MSKGKERPTGEKVEGQVGNPVRRSKARSAGYKIHVDTLTLYHVTITAFFIKIVDVKLALSLNLKESEVSSVNNCHLGVIS